MKILLEAPILTQSGYGEHARLVFRSLLLQEGVEIYTNPLNWGNTSWASSVNEDLNQQIHSSITRLANSTQLANQTGQKQEFDVQVHVGIPSEFEKKAAYSVCVTAGIETDRVSPEWLFRTYRGIDKLIVPSEHAKSGFTNTSYEAMNNHNGQKTVIECNSPIEVVPYPVKNTQPIDLGFTTDTEFNFLSIALLGPRKNIENMIKWFVEEFKDDNVGLVLKTGRLNGGVIDREYTEKHISGILSRHKDRKCKVYLLHGDLEEGEIHSLYLRDDIHAYISATHGEGYGLPIFEAAYSGLPIVATDWSAHVEFLTAPYKESGKLKNKKLFAKVDYDLKPIPKSVVWKDILVDGSNWAYPNERSFKNQMRNVYKNHGMYKKWSMLLKNHVMENYNTENIVNLMKNRIFSINLRLNIERFDRNILDGYETIQKTTRL